MAATLAPPTEYVDIGTIITCTPGVYGGQPCIQGTRMPVRMLVWRSQNEGLTPAALADDYPNITERDVWAALAFYHANREGLEAEWAALDEEGERLKAEYQAARARGELPDW